MYTHARTHKGYRIFFVVAVLITAAAFLCGVTFAALVSDTAFAAPINPTAGTLLASGSGLVIGSPNAVRTSGGSFGSQSYSSASPQESDLYGCDFWFDYGTAGNFNTTNPTGTPNVASFSSEMMSLKYYTLPTSEMTNAKDLYFRSKIRIDENGALYSNLASAQTTVTFAVSAEIRASEKADGYADRLTLDWFFSDNGVDSNVRGSTSKEATGDWETVTSEAIVSRVTAAAMNLNNKAYFQINIGGFTTEGADTAQSGGGISGPTTGIMIDIRNVSVTVTVSSDETLMAYGPLGVRVEGGTGSVRRPDAGSIYVQNLGESTEFYADGVDYKYGDTYPYSLISLNQNRVYIKHGDSVFLYSDVQSEGKQLVISPDYAVNMGADAGTMPINWTFGNEAEWQLFNSFDYRKPTSQSSPDVLTGRTTELYYNKDKSLNQKSITLIPRFITGVQMGSAGEKPVFNYLAASSVTLTFDNTNPSNILFSETDGGVGQYGASSPEAAKARPITSSTTVPFRFISGRPQSPSSGNDIAPETLYYTLTPAGEEAEGPLTNPNRQILTVNQNGEGRIEFPSGRGTEAFKLQMVVIDAAGNYSEVYTRYICVDTNKYRVTASFQKGTTGSNILEPGTSAATEMATIRFFDGSTNSWSGNSSREFGRMVSFSMQIRMNRIQYEKYKLVSVRNASSLYGKEISIDENSLNRPIDDPSNWSSSRPQIGFHVEGSGNSTIYTYTITYVMAIYDEESDDPNTIGEEARPFDFLSTDAARNFIFCFKERAVADVSLTAPEFKFEVIQGVPTAVPQELKVSFNNFNNIDYQVKYYTLTDSAKTAGQTISGLMGIYSTPQAAEEKGEVQIIGSDDVPELPSLAGEYWYWIYIPEGSATGHDRNYYIDMGGLFTIEKADPKVKDVAFINQDGNPFRLVYSKGGMQNILLERSIRGKDSLDRYSHEYSSIGVPGEYVIKNPTPTSDNYKDPIAGQYIVTVAFNPANVGGILSSDNFRSSEDIMLELTVIPFTVLMRVAEGQELSVVYNKEGLPQPFTVEVSFDEGNTWLTEEKARQIDPTFLLDYQYKSEGQSSFTDTVPTNAGRYDVKVDVDRVVNNYQGSFTLSESEGDGYPSGSLYTVEKERLNIEYKFEESYVYSYFTAPSPKAFRWFDRDETQPEWVERNLSFRLTYKKEGEEEFTAELPYGAGVYFARIEIVAANYEGNTDGEEIRFTVERANLENTDKLNANFPMAMSTVKSETGAHAVYGDRLGEVRLATGNAYNVTYTPGGQNRPVVVSGTFRFAESPEEYESLGLSEAVPAELRTHFNTPLNSVGKKSVIIVFIPEDRDNYDVLFRTLDITVDKAKPLYDKLAFGEIVYGQTFSEAELFGDMYINAAVYETDGTGATVLEREEKVSGEIRYLNAQPYVVYPVGRQEILAEFIPSDASAEKFYGIEFSIILNVAKQPAEITADDTVVIEYGSCATLDGKAGVNIAGEILLYRVFRTTAISTDTEITPEILGDELTFSRRTAAGLYVAEIYIGDNSNYSASKFVYLQIVEATPDVVQRSEIADLEIGKDVYSYESEKGWEGFVLAVHPDAAFSETVEGTIRLENGQTLSHDVAGRYAYSFVFRPTGDYAANYKETVVELYVTVSKKTVGITAVLEGMSKVYTGQELYPTVIIDEEELSIADLVWSDAPVDAGSYNLTVRISDANEKFRGSLEIKGFVVTRDTGVELTVVKDKDKAAWTGGDIFADGAFTLSAASGEPTEFSLAYYDYIGYPVAAMTEVGRYEVRITLGGNYEGALSFDFFVIPATVTYEDAEDGVIKRVYNPESTMTGRVNIAEVIPASASSAGVVEYAPVTGRGEIVGEFEQTVPYLAGSYVVRTRFTVNGYNGSDDGIIMEIERAQAEVTRAPAAEYVYTGRAPEMEIAFRQTGLEYYVKYSADGGEFSDEPNIAAGDGYEVKITVVDGNYQGEFVYPYIIKKGEVSLVGTVTLEATQYGTALDELSAEELTSKFGYYGAFVFGNESVEGTFTLITSGIASLPVWQYDVNYVFTPKDPSIEEYHGVVNLNIIKRNISEWLAIDQSSLTASYDGRQKTVSVIFSENAPSKLTTSVKNGILSSVNVSYRGLSSTPLNAGSYEVTVTLGHVNYSATLSGTLNVEKATPEIVAPDPVATLDSPVQLSKNGIITSDGTEVNLNAIGSVYAIIASNGVPVSGTFSIDTTDGSAISGANRKAVKVLFTPEDTDNFNAVETEVYVMLRKSGAEIGITGVTLPTIPVYGKTLGEAYNLERDLTVSGAWATSYENYGAFRFENADFVPSVGTGNVKLIFELNEANVDSYNNKEFEVSVTVQNKAEVGILGDVYLDVRLGEVYGDGRFVLPEDFAYLADFGTFSLTEKAGNTVERADITATAVIGYKYESENYTVNSGNARVKLLITPEEFSIANDNAEYRGGAAIEKSELFGLTGISVPNIDSVSGGFLFKVLKDGAEVDAMTDAGVYTVTASVNRTVGIGAGEFTFQFTVTPMDLSEYIDLNGGKDSISTVYLSGVQLFPELVGEAADIENIEFLFYYKKAGDDDGKFSIYDRPQNAGEYVLRVSVEGNDFYAGHRDYPYVVEKKEVRFTVGTQVFTYGGAREAEVIISDGLTRADYELIYRSEDGVVFRTVPSDAGAYTATVTVTNANYTGSYSFAYTINREKTVVSEWVTFGAIVYGQPVSAAQMNAPAVSPTVAGHFELEDPSLILGAGDRTVRVLYIPDNRNYTTESYEVDIRVNKAQTGLNFDVLGKQYTGQSLKPTVTVPGDASLVEFVSFTFFRFADGSYVPTDAPVLPGTYYVRASLEHENYTYSMAAGTYREFNVYRAEVKDYEVPTVSPIAYGKSLEGNSAISGGYAVYYNGTEEGIRVAGSFSFVNGNVSLGDADEENGKNVKLKFTPDSANYEPFECDATVLVVKAAGSVTVVSGNSVVYGNPVTYPVLKVAPDSALRVRYDDGFVAMVGNLYNVGQYTVTAWIDDANYTGEITFTYSVTRAPAEIVFTNADGRTVNNYNFEFGDATSRIYAALADGFTGDREEVATYFDFTYTSADGTLTYDSFERILAGAGSYRVTVSLSSGSNYTGSASVDVTVRKRVIDDVTLPVSSLQEQIYGSVSRPTVEIYKNGRILTGVSYYIDYGDSGRVMPTRAGTYMIMVVIDDKDYEPYRKQATFVINKKPLTVEDITVENKLFDGVPGLTVAGNLSGVLLGDEVTLHLAARVKDGEIDPGTYGVDIVTAELGGLDAGNYSLVTPAYNGTVTITSNRLYDVAEGGSYVIYGDNVSKDSEFSVGTVESPLG